MAAASSIVEVPCSLGRTSTPCEYQVLTNGARWHLARLSAMVIALLALSWPKGNVPKLLWNASPSIPIGLYMGTSRRPAKGDLAVIRLPEMVRRLAAHRGYLPRSTLLIKPVVASSGDVVCRHGTRIVINGVWRITSKVRDGRGRILPHWRGCVRLTASQVFALAATVNDSFDSRYIGPIEGEAVLGTGTAVWTQ